jgi:hypothetical protein
MDLLHDDFPTVNPRDHAPADAPAVLASLGERSRSWRRGRKRTLVGSISKTDLLLTMAQGEGNGEKKKDERAA